LQDYQAQYLTLFRERLPRKPYATDDPSRGVRIMPAQAALRKRYIQVGRYPHAVFRLVVDVDHPGEWWWDRMEELPPSLILVNPENKHAHVFYELADSVPVEAASRKTLGLLADVEALLEAYFAADPGYVGLLARNPVWWATHHPDHVLGGGRLWTLTDLAYLLHRFLPRGLKVKREASGYGRNCTLFDVLRHHAYLYVDAFRRRGDFEGFRSFLAAYASAQNQALFRDHPKGPLLANEVKHTVKSVAGWTWEKNQGRRVVIPVSSTGRPDRSRLSRQERAEIPPLSPEEQEEIRRQNAASANQARQQEAREKLATAYQRLLERGAEITVSGLASEAGVDPKTARAWLRKLKG
jgi:hypothetical protein